MSEAVDAGVSVTSTEPGDYDMQVQTLIIGAGACGLVAALSAHECGQQVLVVEADAVPSGSTALSAGLIPAAGTRLQRAAGIEDSVTLFASDIQAKAEYENVQQQVNDLAAGSSEVIHWLMDRFDFRFSLVDDFDYPGHSRRRMHGLPSRSGTELVDALRHRCEEQGIDIVCHRRARVLHADGLRVKGVQVLAPQHQHEHIACDKLILACNGYGGNRQLVSQLMPGISKGLWFGHDGNRGEAVTWGLQLGAKIRHLGAFQGHGNVAHPHGILITWAVITEGGVQVNRQGQRFWNETQGYSEAAEAVLAQDGAIAFTVFDERIAAIARQFQDFRRAEQAGAIHVAATLHELAASLGIPEQALQASIESLPRYGTDQFGRRFDRPALGAPYHGVRVTGALFHTQGGLDVDTDGRVIHESGQSFVNLFAGGGAACGVSGSADSGYLSGNGLLSAVVLGYKSGRAQCS